VRVDLGAASALHMSDSDDVVPIDGEIAMDGFASASVVKECRCELRRRMDAATSMHSLLH
jgi:hypothetical protein